VKLSPQERKRWKLGALRSLLAAGGGFAALVICSLPFSSGSFHTDSPLSVVIGVLSLSLGAGLMAALYSAVLGLPLGLLMAWCVRRWYKITVCNSTLAGLLVGSIVAVYSSFERIHGVSVSELFGSLLANGFVGAAGGWAFGYTVTAPEQK